MGQGNDKGTQYRSGIYVSDEAQLNTAEVSRGFFQQALAKAGHGAITTEIIEVPEFFITQKITISNTWRKTRIVIAVWVEPV